jgi:uncharacterized surface protein with fasciclin (FAS1) repeats
VQGAKISVDVVDEGVVLDKDTPNPATVVLVDVRATNGIIHAIDMVLTPPAMHAR